MENYRSPFRSLALPATLDLALVNNTRGESRTPERLLSWRLSTDVSSAQRQACQHRYSPGGIMAWSGVLIGAAALCGAVCFAAAQADLPLDVFAVTEENGVLPGGAVRVAIHLRMPSGLYINTATSSDPYLVPTSISLAAMPGVQLSRVVYPDAVALSRRGASRALRVLPQDSVVGASLTIGPRVTPQQLIVPLVVRYQACSMSGCDIPARTESFLEVRVVSAQTPRRRQFQELFQRLDATGTSGVR